MKTAFQNERQMNAMQFMWPHSKAPESKNVYCAVFKIALTN